MKTETTVLIKTVRMSVFGLMLLPVCLQAQAATTVVVDNDDHNVVVAQPVAYVQAVTTPIVITQEVIPGDFEGRVVDIDYARYQIIINDTQGRNRAVVIQPEAINDYRIGDYVLIHPSTAVTLVTMQENPKDFEGEIIRMDIPNSQIIVLDTNGRERKVDMKKGMIGTYKVDDYVQVHLMADLKEAKTINTVTDVRNLDGRIMSVDASRSQIVIRSNEGKDNAVYVRRGQINNYRVGDNVRVYLLQNREQVQVIRVIR